MRGMIRKTSAVTLCMVMMVASFTLSGCGRKSEDTYIDEGSSTREITFFINQSDENTLKIFNQAGRDFEKDTGVKVSYANYVQDSGSSKKSYDEVAQARLESNDPDELYILNAGVIYKEQQKGNLAALTVLKGMSGLKESAMEGGMIGSKQYCLPMVMVPYCFFSNTKILKKYGLSIPENLQEFYSCCRTLKARGVKPFAANKWWLEVMVLARGMSDIYMNGNTDADIRALNDGTVNISSYMDKGFRLVKEMEKKGYLDLQETYDTDPGEEAAEFNEGKCAFMVCMASAVGENYVDDVKDHIALTGVPVRDDGSVMLLNPDMRVCVSAHAEGRKAAMGFVRYLSKKKYTEQFARVAGRYSIREDARTSGAEMMRGLDECISSNEVMPCQNYRIKVEQWDNTTQILWKMMTDKWTVDQADSRFDELQQQAVQ